jgi:hypothetical protein
MCFKVFSFKVNSYTKKIYRNYRLIKKINFLLPFKKKKINLLLISIVSHIQFNLLLISIVSHIH